MFSPEKRIISTKTSQKYFTNFIRQGKCRRKGDFTLNAVSGYRNSAFKFQNSVVNSGKWWKNLGRTGFVSKRAGGRNFEDLRAGMVARSLKTHRNSVYFRIIFIAKSNNPYFFYYRFFYSTSVCCHNIFSWSVIRLQYWTTPPRLKSNIFFSNMGYGSRKAL